MRNIQLNDVDKSYKKNSFHSKDPEETYNLAHKNLRFLGNGAFYGLQEIGHFDTMGLPVFKVLCANGLNEWGKGLTAEQCKASAIMERVERISSISSIRNDASIVTSAFNSLKEEAVSRKKFGLMNLHYVIYGEDSIDDREMDWVTAESLISKKSFLVPAQWVFLRHRNRFADYLCSTGLASGNSIEEAVMQAICEVIERHVLHKMYFNRPKVRQINLGTIEHPTLKSLIHNLKGKGFEVIANDFSDGWKIASVSALAFNPKESIIFGENVKVGTSTDPEVALIRAITEVAQGRAVSLYRNRYGTSSKGFFGAASKDSLEKYKWLTEDSNMISIKDVQNISKDNFREEIEESVNDIRQKGYDVLAYDLTHPKLGIPVVRVMIPGLQPNFYAKGLHYMDKKSIVTPHLKIFEEVMEKVKKREFLDQKLDEVQELNG